MVRAATSLPPPGSLTPMQDAVSPAIAGARNCLFNSSLPKLSGNLPLRITLHLIPKLQCFKNPSNVSKC